MKKLLKKIGVLGLIIAILAPFIELPTVNAAEGCNNHLQNYLWLDMNIFDSDIEDVSNVTPVGTIFDGKLVYDKAAAAEEE